MKRLYLKLLLCLCLSMIAGCTRKHMEPSIELGSSSVFTQAELQEATDALINEFLDEWEDCVLTSIVYNGDESSQRKADYYEHEKGVEFLIDFETGSFASPSLNPNSKYVDYQFFMVKEEGKWVVDYAACGYG